MKYKGLIMFQKLSKFFKTIDGTSAPTSVANKKVNNWGNRLDVFRNFLDNYQEYAPKMRSTTYSSPPQKPLQNLDNIPPTSMQTL